MVEKRRTNNREIYRAAVNFAVGRCSQLEVGSTIERWKLLSFVRERGTKSAFREYRRRTNRKDHLLSACYLQNNDNGYMDDNDELIEFWRNACNVYYIVIHIYLGLSALSIQHL